MSNKSFLTLAVGAAALVATSLATVETASARGGGFHGSGFGGGFHGGGLGGFHAGGFGGFHGGGFAPGLRGGAFAPRFGENFHGRGFRRGLGFAGAGLALGALAYPFYDGYGYGDYYGSNCYIEPRRVPGPHGWTIQDYRVCY